jgi:(E)-4-hydroxy-3-methylbut-2-enyl-diphosphate synthase
MIVNPIKRRPTRKIRVGSVYVGGDAPISVQSMTNTETCDVDATVAQIQRCADAGADIMRVSVPSMEAAEAFGAIRKRVSVPLVADIHFDHRIALAVADYGADCFVLIRNIGSDQKVREVVAAAKHHGISIRIGVNAGSLEKDYKSNMVNQRAGIA